MLADTLKNSAPQIVAIDGISAFQHIGVTEQDCADILTHAKHHLGSLHWAAEALQGLGPAVRPRQPTPSLHT